MVILNHVHVKAEFLHEYCNLHAKILAFSFGKSEITAKELKDYLLQECGDQSTANTVFYYLIATKLMKLDHLTRVPTVKFPFS
jgi:hypothetical protein